ncbi:hypothetical protein L9F63_027269, partial [Diploptera punctata]
LWPMMKGNFNNVHWDDLIPLVLPACMAMFTDVTWQEVIWMWMWITVASSLVFHIIAFNGAHHHPDIFHEGDAP